MVCCQNKCQAQIMDVLGQCEGLFLKMRSDLGISGALEVDMEPGVVQDCFEKGALY